MFANEIRSWVEQGIESSVVVALYSEQPACGHSRNMSEYVGTVSKNIPFRMRCDNLYFPPNVQWVHHDLRFCFFPVSLHESICTCLPCLPCLPLVGVASCPCIFPLCEKHWKGPSADIRQETLPSKVSRAEHSPRSDDEALPTSVAGQTSGHVMTCN
jgi:hypothetical protein